MVGTLESLLRAKPGTVLPQEAPPPVAQDSSLAPRIDALETQITALTTHIEQIGRQMSALEAKLAAAPDPAAAAAAKRRDRRPSGRVEAPRARSRQRARPRPIAATTATPPSPDGMARSPAAMSWPLCWNARRLRSRKT